MSVAALPAVAVLPVVKYMGTMIRERCIKASKVFEPQSVQHNLSALPEELPGSPRNSGHQGLPGAPKGSWGRAQRHFRGDSEVQHNSGEEQTAIVKTAESNSISEAASNSRHSSVPAASQRCECLGSGKQQLEITMVKNGVEMCTLCSNEIRLQIPKRRVSFSKEKPLVIEFEYVPPKNSRRKARALESLLRMKSRHPRRRYHVPDYEYEDLTDSEDEGPSAAAVPSSDLQVVIDEC